MSKVCDGQRGDAFVAAQEVGFDNLCESVHGRPRGKETLIQHMRKMVFLFWLNTSPKNSSASIVALKDPCPDNVENEWNNMSRDDDVVGHFWLRWTQ